MTDTITDLTLETVAKDLDVLEKEESDGASPPVLTSHSLYRRDLYRGIRKINTPSGAHVLAVDDEDAFLNFSTGSSPVPTCEIPLDSTTDLRIGTRIVCRRSGAGDLVVTAAAGVLLNGTDGGSITAASDNQAAVLIKVAANTWWAYLVAESAGGGGGAAGADGASLGGYRFIETITAADGDDNTEITIDVTGLASVWLNIRQLGGASDDTGRIYTSSDGGTTRDPAYSARYMTANTGGTASWAGILIGNSNEADLSGNAEFHGLDQAARSMFKVLAGQDAVGVEAGGTLLAVGENDVATVTTALVVELTTNQAITAVAIDVYAIDSDSRVRGQLRTASYTLTAADSGSDDEIDTSAGAVVITVPKKVTDDLGDGFTYSAVVVDATNAVTVECEDAAVDLNGVNDGVATLTATAYEGSVHIRRAYDDDDHYTLRGNMTVA